MLEWAACESEGDIAEELGIGFGSLSYQGQLIFLASVIDELGIPITEITDRIIELEKANYEDEYEDEDYDEDEDFVDSELL